MMSLKKRVSNKEFSINAEYVEMVGEIHYVVIVDNLRFRMAIVENDLKVLTSHPIPVCIFEIKEQIKNKLFPKLGSVSRPNQLEPTTPKK